MAQCEMCGKDATLIVAEIESVEISVCSSCAKLGKIKKTPVKSNSTSNRKGLPVGNIEERVVSNAGVIIKREREKKHMRQVDLAKMLQIKDSYLQLIESGKIRLPVVLAKKIEEALNLTLVKKFKRERYEKEDEEETTGFTIADFIKKKG